MVSRLEDLLLISAPLINDIATDISDRKHLSHVGEKSVLVERIIDQSTFLVGFGVTELLSHDSKSQSYLHCLLDLLKHIGDEDDSSS